MTTKTMAGILDPGTPFDDRLGEVAGDPGSGEKYGRDGDEEPRRIDQEHSGEEDSCRYTKGKSADSSRPGLVGTDDWTELALAVSSTDVIGTGIRSRCDGSHNQEPAAAFGEEAQTEDKGAQHPEIHRSKGQPTEEIITVGKIRIGGESENRQKTERKKQSIEGPRTCIPCHHGRKKRQGKDDVKEDSLQGGKSLAAGHPHIFIGGPDRNDGDNGRKQGDRTFEEEKKPTESKQNSGNDSFH